MGRGLGVGVCELFHFRTAGGLGAGEGGGFQCQAHRVIILEVGVSQ